ncbi:MAG TPA: glycosyltransferase family 39 protein [Candidatus Saccharimonadia bacterium]|nr:glycosyltransferase family 39 protein [Candidatus Saccharimonadia bacterium]
MIRTMSSGASARGEDVAFESSDNAARSRARALFVASWLALFALKLALVASVALFGDEAFYWQESRALAPGYSDIPPLTAWLVALGRALPFAGEAGVRWPFLLVGAALPWLVVAWARCVVDARDAWHAGTLVLCVPLAALLGVFALPDVPLTVAIVAAAPALFVAIRRDRTRDWLLCGALVALGWLSHYRYAMFYLAGAAFLLVTPDGRAMLRRPGFWLAQCVGAAGLLPSLAFNYAHDFAALSFQFVDRHAWAFDPRALREPFVQALVTTPVLFAACVVAIVRGARAPRAPGTALLWTLAAGLLGGYLVVGLFADLERSRFHWPLPAYLLALPLVPALLRDWSRRAAGRALVVAGVALGAALTLAVPFLLLRGNAGATPLALGWLTDNTRGWHEAGAWFDEVRRRGAGGDALIADNFMLAAELDFALGGAVPIHVLDHPANRKHGRAAQLAIWSRDEAALRAMPWRRGILAVEETSRRPVERLDAYRSLCERFGAVRMLDELRLDAGRAVFVAFEVVPGRDARTCELPAFGYIDAPVAGAIAGETVAVRGWAISERAGIARVEVLVDGESRATARYGLPRPEVRAQWPRSEDPGHPRVGFEARLELATLARGPHELALRLTDGNGRTRIVAEQLVERR